VVVSDQLRIIIETKTPSDLQQRDRESLCLTDRARTHQELELRNQDFRQSRRREFGVDTYHPQPRAFGTRPQFSQSFEGPPVHGLVKWFNPDKGFGFVELSDGSGDAFLHGTILAQIGINAVQPGETLEVRVGPGHKGPHITEIISVDRSTAVPAPPPPSNFRATTSNGSSSGVAVEEAGTVRWFNIEKGFGFIARDGGGKDVFVHISALERSGLTGLAEGQPVIVDVVEGRKGLEAARVRLV
jgi:CspA family cold shock protein